MGDLLIYLVGLGDSGCALPLEITVFDSNVEVVVTEMLLIALYWISDDLGIYGLNNIYYL